MQERLNRLEQLVLAAVGDKDVQHSLQTAPSAPSPEVKASPDSAAALMRAQSEESSSEAMPAIGVLEIKDNRSQLYTGDTAWSGILHEVRLEMTMASKMEMLTSKKDQ